MSESKLRQGNVVPQEDRKDPTAEPQRQDNPDGLIHIPQVFASEFGTARSIVRMQLTLGHLEIDDVEYQGSDNMDVPEHLIKNHLVSVIGPERQWRMKYLG